MSYLSTSLQRQTERRRLTQSDLARGSGLSKSFISRLFSGESHELSNDNFIAILKNFSADPHAQADLIAARCMDARASAAGISAADLVEIKIKSTTEKRPSEPPQVQLSHETERAFSWLRSQCPLNPDLEKHLIGYAKLTGMK